MDYSTIHQLDKIEAAAYTAMYAAAPVDFVRIMGLSVHQYNDAALLMAPKLPDGFFNRVIGLGNESAVREDDIDAIIDRYRDIGVSGWWAQVSESQYSSDLQTLLDKRGFEPAQRPLWAKFSLKCDAIVPVEVPDNVREVKTEEADAFGRMMCMAYEMPDILAEWFAAIAKDKQWKCFGVFDGDKIVGGGLLFIQGKGAWLGGAGILQEARGKHLHRLLMQIRMRHAKTAGCEWLATETGEPIADEPNPSLHNILGCGFTKVASRKNYQYSK